jgi:hypothetical protein
MGLLSQSAIRLLAFLDDVPGAGVAWIPEENLPPHTSAAHLRGAGRARRSHREPDVAPAAPCCAELDRSGTARAELPDRVPDHRARTAATAEDPRPRGLTGGEPNLAPVFFHP